MQQAKSDPIGTAVGALLGLSVLIAAVAFAGQWAWSKIDPVGYASSQAASAAERKAENAVEVAEAERLKAAQDKRDADSAVYAVYWTHAKDSFENFKLTLADPYSAQFRDVWAVKFGGEGAVGSAVCGVVNAKNAYGAYAGEMPFVATGPLVWTPDHPNFQEQYKVICLEGQRMEKVR